MGAYALRDKRTGKTKGYGFISFANVSDLAAALKEMNGKYVGNRPIKLRKSNWKEGLTPMPYRDKRTIHQGNPRMQECFAQVKCNWEEVKDIMGRYLRVARYIPALLFSG